MEDLTVKVEVMLVARKMGGGYPVSLAGPFPPPECSRAAVVRLLGLGSKEPSIQAAVSRGPF